MSDIWVPPATAGPASLGMQQDQDLAHRITILKNAVPLFSQGSEGARMALQFASSQQSDDDMIRTAQIAASQTVVSNIKDQLQAVSDHVQQYKMYSGLDKGQQQLLAQMGFVAPPKPYDPGDTSPLGIVKGIAGNLVHDVTSVPGLKQGLEVAGKGIKQVQHLYQASSMAVQQEGWLGAITGSASSGGLYSLPADIIDSNEKRKSIETEGSFLNMWDKTGDGEKVFSVKAQDRVHRAVPDEDKFQLVQALASGQTVFDYLTGTLKLDPNSPTFLTDYQKYNQYMVDPAVQDGVKDLKNNHVSFGRDIAGFTGLQRGSAPYNLLSGGLDATFDLVMDPTLAAGKGLKQYRLGQAGIDLSKTRDALTGDNYLSQRIDQLAAKPQYQRSFNQIAMRFNEGNSHLLMDEIPHVSNGIQSMFNYFKNIPGELGIDDVKDYFKSEAGKAALSEGVFDVPHFGTTNLPALGTIERMQGATKTALRFGVDKFRLADVGLDNIPLDQLAKGFGVKMGTFGYVQNAIGEFMNGFITKVPHQNFIKPIEDNVQGTNSLQVFRAMMDFALPRHLQAPFLEDFLAAPTFEAKRAVYDSALDALHHYSGALQTDIGKTALAKFKGASQVYAAGAIDNLNGTPVGIGAEDMADNWAIPHFTDILKATEQQTWFRKQLAETNDGLMTRFMSYWRPSVLLKAGFIPRAYGEELLNFIGREGVQAYTKSQLARIGANEGFLPGMKQAAWLAGAFTDHIPLVPEAFKDTAGMLSQNVFRGTNQALRGFAEKLAPEEYLATARRMAQDENFRDALARSVGTAHGYAQEQLTHQMRAETVFSSSASGDIVRAELDYGDVALRGREDLGFRHGVLTQMRRKADDRLFRPLVDAGARIIPAEQGEQLAQHLVNMGVVEEGSSTYGKTLLNARAQVPDVVMPRWESFLENENFASREGVLDDLVTNGMDREAATNLYNAAKEMSPRERRAIFTRDGELERMHKARMLDPNAAWNYESDLPFVRGQIEEYSGTQLDRHLEDLWSENPMNHSDTMDKIFYDRLHQGDMQDIVQKARRGRETADNRVVATEVAAGHRRVYTLIVPPDVTSRFEDVGVNKINEVVDQKNGWIPINHDEANKLTQNLPGTTPRRFVPAGEIGPGTQSLERVPPPEVIDIPMATQPQPMPKVVDFEGEQLAQNDMAWFSSNHQHAQTLLDQMRAKYPNSGASLGYVDVPERVFRRGQDAVAREAEGGIDPLANVLQQDQVYIPKTWRQNYTAVGDDVHPINDGKDLAVGATQQEAFHDWAQVGGQAYRQLFGGGNVGWDETLGEIQHKLMTGRISIEDLGDLTENQLPEGVVGPRLMLPSHDGIMNRVYRKGFEVIQGAGDALIRQPMFIHEYTKAMADARPLIERMMGDPNANAIIDELTAGMHGNRNQVISAWNHLKPEIQNAANPYEAALARDPIHEVLRNIDQQQLQKIGEASEALYMHNDQGPLRALKEDKEFTAVSGHPDDPINAGKLSVKQIDDAKEAYLSFDPNARARLVKHGVPDVFPKELMPSDEISHLTADQWADLRSSLENNKHLEDTITKVATNKAITNVIPFIHDHHLRSQFQEHARNFVPFWFAQENFIGRMANTVMRDPTIIRKAQLMQHGLEASGVVTKNQFGEEVFNIPATGALTGVLAKAANYFGDYTLPVVHPFTGQVTHTLPGIDELTSVAPSFSPIITLPVEALRKRFPELEGAADLVTQGHSNRSVIEQLVPGWAYNFYAGLTHDPNSDIHMMSSSIQAAQMLEAAGHGLSETDAQSMSSADVKGTKLQEYFDRLDNHTRLNYMLKGIIGFFSPAAPNPDPTEQFSPEFQKLLQTMPLQEAQLAFMSAHPDALPYTIFKTQVGSGAPLPASEAVMQVLTDNPEFIGKYPDAAPWLLPQSNSTDSFSQKAYNQQLAMGLRTRKSVKEWYEDYYFASAAPDYFATEDDYNTRYSALNGNPQAREALNNQWATFKEGYFKAHPIFSETLQDPTSKERRARILSTISGALEDENAPDVIHAKPMADMVATYQDLQSQLDKFKGSSTQQRDARAALKDRFTNWAMMYTNENPQVSAFYNRVIRPDLRS